MNLTGDFRKALSLVLHPDVVFEGERESQGYWPVLRFFLVLSVILALLTPFVNWFHIPCDIVHAGTNAQVGAYLQAPLLEASTGISRYFWVGILTYFGNVLKIPLLGLLFHIIAKGLRGTGTILDSLKIGVFSASPVLLFGWISYFGLISGLWVGYLYVMDFCRLHNTSLGATICLVNLLIGVQVASAFLFGWLGSSEPW